jgi:hypothetical protein
MADLVLGQKPNLSTSNLSLVVRPSSVVRLPSSASPRPSSFALRSSSQSQEVQKKCSKNAQNLFIFVNFCKKMQKNAKKCKFLLIFTPIFRLKTNKSYKITFFTIANHPIFQNFPQKPNFFKNLPQKTIPK